MGKNFGRETTVLTHRHMSCHGKPPPYCPIDLSPRHSSSVYVIELLVASNVPGGGCSSCNSNRFRLSVQQVPWQPGVRHPLRVI